MAAIHARGKNGDNSILVGEGLKMQNSQQKSDCSKKIRKNPILDIAPYTIRTQPPAQLNVPIIRTEMTDENDFLSALWI